MGGHVNRTKAGRVRATNGTPFVVCIAAASGLLLRFVPSETMVCIALTFPKENGYSHL